MTTLRWSINIFLLTITSLLLAFDSSDSVHEHIAQIYEKKSDLLKSVDQNLSYGYSLEQESLVVNKNLDKIKEQASLSRSEGLNQMRQTLYWHFHDDRGQLLSGLMEAKTPLPRLSLMAQLRKKNQVRLKGIIQKEKFLEHSLEGLQLKQEDSWALYYKQLNLLEALEEEEKVLKTILAELLQSEHEKAQHSLDKEDLLVFDKNTLSSPLLHFPKRAKKDFMGAHIIEAKKGEEIRAVADGTVIFSDCLKGLGNMLIIEHTDKYLSLYANCEKSLASTGHQVLQGQTIALVGNSGQMGTEGLYFELRSHGDLLELPQTWLP